MQSIKRRLVGAALWGGAALAIVFVAVFVLGAVVMEGRAATADVNPVALKIRVDLGRAMDADMPMEGIWIDVDQSAQTLTVMRGDQVVRRMAISSGKDGTPTPNGVFRVQNRGKWFFSSRYGQGARYWVSFLGWGKYLVHSVPCDASGRVIAEEADLLGNKASHGCIRLAMEDARWFYEAIPDGTVLKIHD